MLKVTPEHLASVTRAALEATELHRRNIGVYGSTDSNLDKYGRAWLQVRDYYTKEHVQTWYYVSGRKSAYRRAMAKAERVVQERCDRVVAAKVLELLEADLYVRHERLAAAS